MYFDKDILEEYHIDFNLLDIPHEKFIFGAEAYLGLRENKFRPEEIYYASSPLTIGIEASLHGLFYDFHSLMNNEIIFLHLQKYIRDKNFKLSEEEYAELDELAKLMLEPDKNFDKLLEIWNKEEKFRIMSGGMMAGMKAAEDNRAWDGYLINQTEKGIGLITLKNNKSLSNKIENMVVQFDAFMFIENDNISSVKIKKLNLFSPVAKTVDIKLKNDADFKLIVRNKEKQLPYHEENFAKFISRYKN